MKQYYALLTLCVCVLAGLCPALDLQFTVSGEAPGDQLGDAVTAVDFNGDGYDDIVIGAPASDANGTSSGKVYLYLGGPGADDIADFEFVGPDGSFFGAAIAAAGDFNNDTYPDLIIGAPYYSAIATRAGAAFIYFGGPSADTTADLVLFGGTSLDYYGTAVAGGFDFNGDTIDDIAIGAYKAEYDTLDDAGLVAVHLGSAAVDTVADIILTGGADGERFGFALTGGNFNGDAFDDIAVGAYSYDDWTINLGRVYLFNGGATPDSIYDFAVGGEAQGSSFGYSVAAGDVNNDTYDDLLVGAQAFIIGQAAAGKIYLFEGSVSMDTLADFSYTRGIADPDNLGFDVSTGVDITGDAIDDFWAGYPGGDGGILFESSSYVIDTTLGGSSGENFGHAAGLARGFFGNQKQAVAVGAHAYDSFRGRTYFYLRDNSSGANQPPVLDPIGPQEVVEGNTLDFTVTASDPDGADPALSASLPLPDGAFFNEATGIFDWTPDTTQAGIYNVTFFADDGIDRDSEIVTITVINYTGENLPPVLDPIGPKAIAELLHLSFTVTASDPDGPTPALSTSLPLPDGATFNTGSGVFSWIPDTTQAGVYEVTFYADDGQVKDSEIVTITVTNNTNIPPELNPIGGKTIDVDSTLNFDVTASDPDGPTPMIFASTLPAGATLSSNGDGSRTFNWIPDSTQAGSHSVTFYAFDGQLTDSELVVIQVIGPIVCGDANSDYTVNVGDPVFLINYVFKGGPAAVPLCRSDANGDTFVNVGDAVALINFVFSGGPAPVEPCCP